MKKKKTELNPITYKTIKNTTVFYLEWPESTISKLN